ncbi:4'-phosphopantetheinyl transferase superfamily protein [Phyllobacterium sp. 0TCS1.6C]|uniref:4'-phosphopantetheinyl transferase family protein n=1 Tax=unclassified Phyllobacterium TaxID=2638441 RepID=UPI0022650376|nr:MULTISPECIES: 4'-phosphopantetheinyl transferase superfamily protein [unclassified Phyllobacterium]MCX8280368.1 4'-phosphopantetheinyl transferase superfamily protein [Phyllobacterium sp. 0TCS1.6C]MCX8295183.1 4'-phosphopantetheinyl transferase superfamily protein [Phyllobacterium sp. 0TCS1.6A]
MISAHRLPFQSGPITEAEGPAPRPGVEFCWWDFADRAVDWKRIGSKLADDERQRAAGFHFDKDRNAFIAGRYLQRLVLSELTGLALVDIPIEQEPGGKPYLAKRQGGERIAFNLSNMSGLVVFAASADCTHVGVDAERRDAVLERDMMDAFCSPRERSMVEALDGAAAHQTLLALWVLKESFLKATGEGLGGVVPAKIEVSWTADGSIRIIHPGRSDQPQWHHRLVLLDNCLAAISARTDGAAPQFFSRRLPDPLADQ